MPSVTEGLPLVAVPTMSHGLMFRFAERATSNVAAPEVSIHETTPPALTLSESLISSAIPYPALPGH